MIGNLFGFRLLATITLNVADNGQGEIEILRDKKIPASFDDSFEVKIGTRYCMVFFSMNNEDAVSRNRTRLALKNLALNVLAHEGQNVWYGIFSKVGAVVVHGEQPDTADLYDLLYTDGGCCNTPLTRVYPPYERL